MLLKRNDLICYRENLSMGLLVRWKKWVCLPFQKRQRRKKIGINKKRKWLKDTRNKWMAASGFDLARSGSVKGDRFDVNLESAYNHDRLIIDLTTYRIDQFLYWSQFDSWSKPELIRIWLTCWLATLHRIDELSKRIWLANARSSMQMLWTESSILRRRSSQTRSNFHFVDLDSNVRNIQLTH